MNEFRSVDAIRSYLGAQSARHGREEAESPGGPTGPFVTFSREAGAGATTVAEHLAGILNASAKGKRGVPWTVFDQTLVREVLDQHELPESYVDFMPEDTVSETQLIVQEMFGAQPSHRSLVMKTSRTILHLASMGHAILVGRGASVLGRRLSGGVHVRLIGSEKRRLEWMKEYYKLPEPEARAAMERLDSGRRNYVRKYFREDVRDPLLYDLVINTDHVEYEKAAALVAEVMGLIL